MSTEAIETPTNRAKQRHRSSAAHPSRVRFGVAGFLRWSERFVDRMVGAYNRTFCLEQEDQAEIYMRIGADYAKNGKHGEAVSAYRRTLEINPEQQQAWLDLGRVHLRQEASADALAAFDRAAAAGLDLFELHFSRSEALSDLDRNDEAVEALYRALEQRPEPRQTAEAAYRLGVALDLLERYEEAVAAFKIAVAHAPREASYYQSLGFTLESLGQRDDAIKHFKRAVELERRSKR